MLCTALYCACVCLQGAGINVVGPAGPSLAIKLRTDVSSVGSILSAEGAGAAAGVLLIPLLLGQLPGHTVLCVLSASIGVSLCGVWLCGGVGQVTVLYFVLGGLLGSSATALAGISLPSPLPVPPGLPPHPVPLLNTSLADCT